MVLKRPPHLKSVAALPSEIECATVQLYKQLYKKVIKLNMVQ